MQKTRTDQDMLDSGKWNKAGKKAYRHVSGHEVRYDHNAWGWTSTACQGVYKTLWAVRYETERAA
jgi:hypothetical protein